MKNIYLVGFMGTGKTAVGRLLAARLNLAFVDMDELIVERRKMSIAEIFSSRGEAYFRQIENELVIELTQKTGLVVACGGGTFINQANIDSLKAGGLVICLTSLPETILARTAKTNHRPLLAVIYPQARIQELLTARAPYYSQAHHIIDADRLTVEETVEEILALAGNR